MYIVSGQDFSRLFNNATECSYIHVPTKLDNFILVNNKLSKVILFCIPTLLDVISKYFNEEEEKIDEINAFKQNEDKI